MTTTTTTLLEQLQVLTDEQLQVVYSLYGTDGLNKFENAASDIGNPNLRYEEAEKLINADTNREQKEKLFKMLEDNHDKYVEVDNDLADLEQKAKEACAERTRVKKGFKLNIDDFTSELRKMVKGTNKTELDKIETHQRLQEARAKRDKIRLQGKRAFLRGVVAAAIDNEAEQYIDECNTAVQTIVVGAKAAIAKQKDPAPKSLEGTKEVLIACGDQIKNLTNSESNVQNGDRPETRTNSSGLNTALDTQTLLNKPIPKS